MIPKEHVECIIKVVQQSPTYSVIVIDAPVKKARMVELTKGRSGIGQEHIQDCSIFLLFVMDFNKIKYISQYEDMPLEIIQYWVLE